MKLTQKVKCTWPTPEFCVGTQRNLYSTGLHLGFVSGKTQLLGFASGKTRKIQRYRDTNLLVFFALGNAKVLSSALGDAKVPDASSFASQWNIGLTLVSDSQEVFVVSESYFFHHGTNVCLYP